MIIGKDGKSQVIVFWSWLNRATFLRARTRMHWIRRRFELWKRTALPSILRQSVTEWHYILVCDARAAQLTAPLQAEIDDPRVRIVHDGAEDRAFRASLPEADRYIVARLDSDDRYHPAVASIYSGFAHRTNASRPYMQFGRGYAHDMRTGELYRWSQSSSPFYALVMGPQYRTIEVVPMISHARVGGRAIRLPGSRFVVSIHSLNTSTTSSSCCVGHGVPVPQAKIVARRFHLGRVVAGKAEPTRKWGHIRASDVSPHMRHGVPR